MIKLIATDLDGTLLNAMHTTDTKILNAIEQIIASGIIFVVATGRAMQGQQTQLLFPQLPIYVISNNGAIITDTQGQIIYEKVIESSFIEKTLTQFPEMIFDFVGITNTWVNASKDEYANNIDFTHFSDEAISRFLDDKVYNQKTEDLINQRIIKMNGKKIVNNGFDALLQRENSVTNAPYVDTIYEITHHKVNKANAIKKLTKKLGINEDEVAVFGDGGNDLEMLNDFRHSYAVENAIESAKEKATHIIGRHDTYSVIQKMLELI